MIQETIFYDRQKRESELPELVCVEGVDHGKRFPVRAGRQNLGREVDNDIVLAEPTVSKRHGVVEYTLDGRVLFYDNGSLNGLYYKGKKQKILKVKYGHLFQIGQATFKLERRGALEKSPPRRRAIPLKFLLPPFLMAGIALAYFLIASGRPPSKPASQVVLSPPPTFQVPRGPVSSPASYPKKTLVELQAQEWGTKAEEAFAAGRYEEAFQIWREILDERPEEPAARRGIKELEKVAGQLFEEALMTQQSDPAAAYDKLRLVRGITEPDSPLHQRVGQLLEGQG